MDRGERSYAAYLSGDENGMVELITLYRDGLMLYLLGFVDDMLSAEEMMEDTFVRLGVRRPKYDAARASFKTFLYTIARNVALDYKRRQRREISIETLGDVADERRDLERLYIRSEERLHLHRAMQQLKAEYRQVLWLVYFENFSHKEVARIMKKSVHSIDTLIYRARNSLKAILEKEGFVYEEL